MAAIIGGILILSGLVALNPVSIGIILLCIGLFDVAV
jgi:hypothetical protein